MNTCEIIYIYTYWVKLDSYGGNKFCFLIVDEVTGVIWSIFENNKSYLTSLVLPVINNIQFFYPIHFIFMEITEKIKNSKNK